METLITATNIVKTFGNTGARVLNGVSISISPGEFTAVMGPSGSGKSTLLFALSGMDRVTSGSVRFCGTELSALKENELADIRRAKMGFVFQQPTMLKNLNLLDNIILPAAQGLRQSRRPESNGSPARRKNTAEVAARAKSLMSRTGIAGLEYRDTAEVSGGQLQRAGICRALINSPQIIFADEPTGALNSKAADEIMELLADINREGAAVLLVTHDARVAARADRILFTKDGSVVNELPLGKYTGGDFEARTGKTVRQMASAGI